MPTVMALFFAALFLVATTIQAGFTLRALAAMRSDPAVRRTSNYLLLAVGVLTTVVAGCFTLLFGTIAATN